MTGLSPEGLRAAAEELLSKARAKQAANQCEWARRRLETEPCPIFDDSAGAWRARHPEIAANERALRKGRAQLLANWKHKNEGTAETHEQASRRNQGALAALYKKGTIDGEQLASAVEIALVAERIASDVAVRTASLETRVDVTRLGDGSFFERLGQVRREQAYTRWRGQLRQPAPVLDMLVGEPIGYTIVAKRYRMGNERAKRLLIDALDLWPQILGMVCKEIDEKDLAAAHRRLAA